MKHAITIVLLLGLISPAYASHKKHDPHPMVAGLGVGLIYMLRASRANEGYRWGQVRFFSDGSCSRQRWQ
jgi:hypothetical protein